MSNWSDTCAKMMKTLCDVTDYDDSDLALLGVKADIDGSFENDFLRGHAVNKYNKLVPYKESGVTKDDIEKECKRRGLGVGWRAAAAPLADRWPLPAVGCCERAKPKAAAGPRATRRKKRKITPQPYASLHPHPVQQSRSLLQ